MDLVTIAQVALRAVGCLWVVGALMLFGQLRTNARLDSIVAALEKMSQEEGKPTSQDWADNGRERWLFAGGVLTLAAGLAMALASRYAVALLACAVIHQLCYFVRQRRRELRAPTPADAEAERPSAKTVNGFFMSLAMAVLAAWLYAQGALG